ncbi:MAG: hypothetical protein WCC11_09965 [Gammaproteobacteria bacterium]
MCEFEKLAAIINGICLSVLIVLYALFNKSEMPSVFALLFVVLIIIIISLVIAFLWAREAERTLQESGARFWNARRIAIALGISLACTLAGIVTIFVYPNNHITIVIILALSFYFGTDLGQLAKIIFRYRKV